MNPIATPHSNETITEAMAVEITMGTPLAEALNTAIQGKIGELGWTGGGAEDSAMSEYFLLMLANGKSQNEIAAEISGDLLGLGPEDQTAPAFAAWLFEQVNALNNQMGGSVAVPHADNTQSIPQDDSSMTVDMDATTETPPGFHAYVPRGTRSPAPPFLLTLDRPTGPKAMRDGGAPRGGREKRMVGNINRTMDRGHDSLHRVQNHSGVSRISRTPPTGPRGGAGGRHPRNSNGRAANLAAGLANMGAAFGGPAGMNPVLNGMGPMNGNFMMGNGQTELLAMMEQQGRMIQEMQNQLLLQHQNGNGRGGHNGRGRSLFERTSRPQGNRRGGAQHQFNGQSEAKTETDGQTEDVEMGQSKPEAQNPDETVCKFNLRCTNKDCKFAHQSPAAPPGVTVDVSDVCSFGVACKNRKCVGRHPSPAGKMAHQGEQDCKFFPNCTNPHCTFRHPTMPPCRNGGECKVVNCKFTHVKTPCKFRPCLNRSCPFTHEEGQRGVFQDKVWTSEQEKDHMSDRKFVDENAHEDLILPETDMDAEQAAQDAII